VIAVGGFDEKATNPFLSFMLFMVDGFTMKVMKDMKIFILGCGAARHAGSSSLQYPGSRILRLVAAWPS